MLAKNKAPSPEAQTQKLQKKTKTQKLEVPRLESD